MAATLAVVAIGASLLGGGLIMKPQEPVLGDVLIGAGLGTVIGGAVGSVAGATIGSSAAIGGTIGGGTGYFVAPKYQKIKTTR